MHNTFRRPNYQSRRVSAIYEALSFDKEAYKEKIQQYVMEHKTDLTIDKIRKNIKVTPADIHIWKNAF